MVFAFVPAILAGLIAGVMMETPLLLLKAIGVRVKQNIFRTWGKMLKFNGAGRYIAGVLFHQVLAVVVALIYAVVFSIIGVRDQFWLWGLVGGAIHYAIAGIVVGWLPSVDPDMPERVGEQGAYYKNYGLLDMVMFLMGHLTFGLMVGLLYGYFTGGGRAAF